MFSSRTPTEEDMIALSENIREEDRIEILSSLGLPPLEAIKFSVKHSDESIAYFYNDKIMAITGVAPPSLLGNIAIPWLITGEEVAKHPLYLVRNSIKIVNKWLQKYEILQNYIDIRYSSALKWAHVVGFKFKEMHPIGPGGLPFYRIEARRDQWAH